MIILNFHGVGPLLRDVDSGEYNCWLDAPRFEEFLDLIEGRNDVELTFDDGNLSDFSIALPALLKRNLKASFFICSGRLDQSTFLKSAQLRELKAAGMRIGSHGVSHVNWRSLDIGQLRLELHDSRRVLELLCDCPITEAACPFGGYDRRVLRELRKAGYQLVFTSDGGGVSDCSRVRARNTVTRKTTQEMLNAMLSKPQRLNRVISNVRRLIKRWR